jgi:hypothetical protein
MNNINTPDDSTSNKSQRELGIIEKLCSTYGFIFCCHRDGRYFFHFSEYKNDIHQAKIGGMKSLDVIYACRIAWINRIRIDVVEFEITTDKRKKKPVAINITLASPEIIGENRVEGSIAVVARQQVLSQQNGVRIHVLMIIREMYRLNVV